MNTAINEIKNTLEATNSRITEAEDRISELEAIYANGTPLQYSCLENPMDGGAW